MARNTLDIIKSKENHLKYSHILEAFSHGLGYKNYNALAAELKTDTGSAEDAPLFTGKTLRQLSEEVDREREENYPAAFDDRFEHLSTVQDCDIFTDEDYTRLLRITKSYTRRVFYAPLSREIFLYVYPNVKDASSPYTMPFVPDETTDPYKECFEIIQHLNGKSWFTRELLDDLIDTMKIVIEGDMEVDDLLEPKSRPLSPSERDLILFIKNKIGDMDENGDISFSVAEYLDATDRGTGKTEAEGIIFMRILAASLCRTQPSFISNISIEKGEVAVSLISDGPL
jgi:hypothetical protein